MKPTKFDRNLARGVLRDWAGLKRPHPLCSRCGLPEETGPCPGCQKYFCADCAEPHFDVHNAEYCVGLRIESPRAENGQHLDPLQLLVNAKLLEDLVSKGLVDVAVDDRGRRLYRKL